MADEKSSKVKNKEKEEGAGREEHRQSAMERLEKTVKKHFEHFDHSHFLCLHGKLVIHSKRALNSRIFPPWTTFSTQSFQGAGRRRRRLFRRRCLRFLRSLLWGQFSLFTLKISFSLGRSALGIVVPGAPHYQEFIRTPLTSHRSSPFREDSSGNFSKVNYVLGFNNHAL